MWQRFCCYDFVCIEKEHDLSLGWNHSPYLWVCRESRVEVCIVHSGSSLQIIFLSNASSGQLFLYDSLHLRAQRLHSMWQRCSKSYSRTTFRTNPISVLLFVCLFLPSSLSDLKGTDTFTWWCWFLFYSSPTVDRVYENLKICVHKVFVFFAFP